MAPGDSSLLHGFKAHHSLGAITICSRFGDLTNTGLEAQKPLWFAQFSCLYPCMAERRGGEGDRRVVVSVLTRALSLLAHQGSMTSTRQEVPGVFGRERGRRSRLSGLQTTSSWAVERIYLEEI